MGSLYQIFMIISMLAPIAFIIFAIIYGFSVLKRMEKRAEERLKINRDSIHLQRKQMEIINQLDQQLVSIENILKNVE